MMTVIFAVVMQFSHRNYHLELDQRAASTLASRIVAQGLGTTDGAQAMDALQGDLQRLSAVNAGVDIYVLDAQGKVLASSIAPEELRRDHVDIAPIRRLLGGNAELPILGTDPSDPSRADVFSAASMATGGNAGSYLYALLHRREHQSGAGLIKASYLVGDGLWIVTGGTLFAVMSSILIVRLLTRRLAHLTADMENYARSDFAQPPDRQTEPRAEADDEVGRLGRTFAEMTQRIVEQMQKLKREEAMRRELLASISNDLRRPLTSVRSHLESLMRKETTLSLEEKREYLEIATRKTARMGKLVSRLSELAGFDAGQVSVQSEYFVLSDVAQDVIRKSLTAAEQRRITLRLDKPEHLPSVLGDSGLIERVLDNLVENALHYTSPGGSVTVRLRQAEGAITVEVVDTGTGIAVADLPKIFDRSFRSEMHRPTSPDHAGFGLAIVKSILKLHGSDIRVESATGIGTTFRFELPSRAGMREPGGSSLQVAEGAIRLRRARS